MLGNASLYTSAPTRIQPQQELGRAPAEQEVRTPVPPTRPEPAPRADAARPVRDSEQVTTLSRSTLVDANGLLVLQEQEGAEESQNRTGRNPFGQQANAGDEAGGGANGRAGAGVGATDGGQAARAGSDDAARQAQPSDSTELTEEEQAQLRELKDRDVEVRAHEQAHASVGGSYASSPRYEFEQGPDGRSYAVGGHVSISTSAVEGDPKATIDKMAVVRRAALAPAEPSGADLRVAAQADQTAQSARALMREQAAEQVQSPSGETPAPNDVDNSQQTEQPSGVNPRQANEFGATPTSFADGDAEAEADGLVGAAAVAPGLVGEDTSDEGVAAPTGNQILGQIGGLDLGQVGEGVRNFVGQASTFVASLIENGTTDTGNTGNSTPSSANSIRNNDTDEAVNSASGSGRAGGEPQGSINLTI